VIIGVAWGDLSQENAAKFVERPFPWDTYNIKGAGSGRAANFFYQLVPYKYTDECTD